MFTHKNNMPSKLQKDFRKAIDYEDDETLKSILEDTNFEVNEPLEDNGKFPFELILGISGLLNILINRPDFDINLQMGPDKMTPLHMAVVHQDDWKLVEQLLNRPNIDVNIVNRYNETPLALAVTNNLEKSARVLLKNPNVNVNVKNRYDVLLIQHMLDISTSYTIIEEFLKRPDLNINIEVDIENGVMRSLLEYFINKSNFEAIELLSKLPSIDINIKDDNYKETPLHIAVASQESEIVSILLKHPDIDVNAQNIRGETPLMYGIPVAQPEIIQLLLDHPKIDVNIQTFDEKESALTFAIQYLQSVKLDMLLEKIDIQINIQNKNGHTPSHTAVLLKHNFMISILSSHYNFEIDAVDLNGQSALHLAVDKDNVQAVKELLRLGADYTLADNDGKLPIDLVKDSPYGRRIEEILINKIR
jgi:ankyrin repeat protein